MAIHVKNWGNYGSSKYGAVRINYCIPCEQVSELKQCSTCKEKVTIFASTAEYRRYRELKLLEKFNEISDLELQPEYPMIINGQLVCRYFADFRYKNNKGEQIIEDVKGMRTATYNLKKKLMKAIYSIDILET